MKCTGKLKQKCMLGVNDYDTLKGKVVDKVAFTNTGYEDEQMFIISFTDDTYVCIGIDHKEGDNNDEQPYLNDFWVMDPKIVNGGNYDGLVKVKSDGSLKFDRWIEILRDFGIWELPDDEVKDIIERDKKRKGEWEYKRYLSLKQEYEELKKKYEQ